MWQDKWELLQAGNKRPTVYYKLVKGIQKHLARAIGAKSQGGQGQIQAPGPGGLNYRKLG